MLKNRKAGVTGIEQGIEEIKVVDINEKDSNINDPDYDVNSQESDEKTPENEFDEKHGVGDENSIDSSSTPLDQIDTSSNSEDVGDLIVKRKRKFLHIAPLNLPLNRRLETVGVIWHTISIPAFIILFLVILSLGWVSWLVVILPYFIWWYGFDLHTPTNGKATYRSRDWVKNLIIWEWFVNYFPIRVHKSCDYEPTFSIEPVKIDDNEDEEDLINENSTTLVDKVFEFLRLGKRLNSSGSVKVCSGPRYVFGYHPHGVISMGVMGLFATNIIRNEPFEPPLKFLRFLFHNPSKFKPLLPNIGKIFPLTLTTQFTLPFYRDYLLSMGLTSASAPNIKSLISNGDNSVCIVVGGAQESLLNSNVSNNPVNRKSTPKSPREIKLVLNKRKGFVKLAIELGNINLVPIFGFGEADIYNIIKPKTGSIGDWFQKWLKKHFHFTIPFFSARGIFIYDFGFLPFRNPINICMGRPIYVPPNLLAIEKDKSDPDKENPPKLKHKNSFFRRKKSIKRPKVPQDILDHYHKLYVDELKRVFEENKQKYGYENVVLNIVE
ncbi:diacylglycerol O-acyltransferase 1 [[Candida] jaroonii]|uniref:Diacylglycerol O-acyltransferase 1 n=1 Tax=[Candida] jaroonii TaxID=467808 RepID=A0ACA9YC92_9ASCO|nr:diacylglycerol O-acyltransferase 1 [[Candida] jaroonii]